MQIRGVLFDVYGTLLDVYAVTRRAEELFPSYGTRVALLWRDKQIEYTRLRTMSGRYAPFSQVTAEALDYALEALGLNPGDEQFRLLLDEYKRLAPFVDVAPALACLRDAGLPVGVLSNGDPEMLETALVNAGLHRFIDPVLSADQVRAYKTDPSVYALGPRALKLPVSEILFVSSNGWDACGATWYGYTTFWINRTGSPPERLGAQPHATGRDLMEAADLLLQSVP